MVVIAAHLLTQSITVFPYINDWLLAVSSKDVLLQHLDTTIHLVQFLGISINFKKPNLVYRGNSGHNSFLRLPAPRITALVSQVKTSPSVSSILIQRLLGHTAAFVPVLPHAQLHMRSLQVCFSAPVQSYERSTIETNPPPGACTESNRLVGVIRQFLGRSPIPSPLPSLVLTSDASLLGKGAHLAGHYVVSRLSTQQT